MRRLAVLIVLGIPLAVGCTTRLVRTVTEPGRVATVDRRAPFLKAHLRDGSLIVFSPWTVDEQARTVTGSGKRYAATRTVLDSAERTIPIDSVVLFETNVAKRSPAMAPLAVVAGVTAALGIYCLSNTKACFGSCPTFYVDDGTAPALMAEGFSASISPRLEARDVDALYGARVRGGDVTIEMRNEAYETHVVRYVNLLAVPRGASGRVMTDDRGRFWSVTPPVAPSRCAAADGDCTADVAAVDRLERLSRADSLDLGAREIIDLTFAHPVDRPGLALSSRQSLLPTYLLYQGLAYLGNSAGSWLAAMERADTSVMRRTSAVAAALGGIDVLVQNAAGGWDSVATVRETGPLATDLRVVPLPESTKGARVRLRMAKGAWRLDAAMLVSLGDTLQPVRITPTEVRANGRRDEAARQALLDSAQVLTTLPGDSYTLRYRLPGDASQFELFLESRGYYLEWMRSEWIAEENPARAAALFLDPAGSLRRLAPQFKRDEASLEDAFWRSKYVPR